MLLRTLTSTAALIATQATAQTYSDDYFVKPIDPNEEKEEPVEPVKPYNPY